VTVDWSASALTPNWAATGSDTAEYRIYRGDRTGVETPLARFPERPMWTTKYRPEIRTITSSGRSISTSTYPRPRPRLSYGRRQIHWPPAHIRSPSTTSFPSRPVARARKLPSPTRQRSRSAEPAALGQPDRGAIALGQRNLIEPGQR
jgi:hypothetical protein